MLLTIATLLVLKSRKSLKERKMLAGNQDKIHVNTGNLKYIQIISSKHIVKLS